MSTSVFPEARLEPSRPSRGRKRRRWLAVPLGGAVAAVLAGVVALGMVPRQGRQAELAEASREIRSLVETPRVKVVRPARGTKPLSLRLPADLLPELQGRLPIRVELRALEKEDFRRILTETEASLIKQYVALMATEGVTLDFTDDAIDALAGIAVDLNATVENIGARRLQTVMERVLDEISYDAPDRDGTAVTIDADYVKQHVGDLAKNTDLSRFIL